MSHHLVSPLRVFNGFTGGPRRTPLPYTCPDSRDPDLSGLDETCRQYIGGLTVPPQAFLRLGVSRHDVTHFWTWLSSICGLVSHSSNRSMSLKRTGDATRCRGEILPLLDVAKSYHVLPRKSIKITPFDPMLKHWDCFQCFQSLIVQRAVKI